MTIQLPTDLESSVRAEVVNGHFASPDDAVAEIVREYFQRKHHTSKPTPGLGSNGGQRDDAPLLDQAVSPVTDKPIWERIIERAAAIPDEEFDKLPVDGAEQHDHYIYGTPKRPTQ